MKIKVAKIVKASKPYAVKAVATRCVRINALEDLSETGAPTTAPASCESLLLRADPVVGAQNAFAPQ